MFTRDSKILSNKLTTPLTEVSRAIGNVFETSFNPDFNQIIKSLFTNNEQGFFYDPNDLTTMFQDSAGTVPVTGAGQPVGLILDKSGHDNHAYQTASASRPILRQNATTGAYYLEFDGADDFLVANSIDFSATDEISLFVGLQQTSTNPSLVVELSNFAITNNGSFCVSSIAGTNQIIFINKGTNPVVAGSASPSSSPANVIITCKGGIATDTTLLRENGTQYLSSDDLGTGNYGNYLLYIGRRGGTSTPFNGHIYSLIGVGRLSTESETAAIEKELAKRTGVTLSV